MKQVSWNLFRFYFPIALLIFSAIRRKIRIRFCLIWVIFSNFSVRIPDRIIVVPPNFVLSDPRIAYEIYSGRYALGGHYVDTGGVSPFYSKVENLEWKKALYDFSWLRHLRAADTKLACANARVLVYDWIMLYGRSTKVEAWEPQIAARRLISWLQCSSFLLKDANLEFRRLFFKYLFLHVRYLRRVSSSRLFFVESLSVRIALIFSGLCFIPSAPFLRSATDNLVEELERQILPDGGHISRNPAVLIDLLCDLLALKQTYLAQGELPSRTLTCILDRMFRAIRFFQHTDGSIARFNGMGATMHQQISSLLSYDDAASPSLLHAPHSGYERLAIGSTTVIADTGIPPPSFVSFSSHAGCLAFEMSSGPQSFIVNCGVDSYGSSELHLFSRSTAAHSTAVLNDTSQGKFTYSSWVHSLIQKPLLGGANKVTCKRIDKACSQGFIARHNAYVIRYGIFHEREIKLLEKGNLLLGVDRFFPGFSSRIAEDADRLTIRFHIHPDVEVESISDDDFILSSRSGEKWTFTAYDSSAQIEESIFFASPNGPSRTVQIVLIAKASEVSAVRWQMRRDSL